jgi:hypothetical protein
MAIFGVLLLGFVLAGLAPLVYAVRILLDPSRYRLSLLLILTLFGGGVPFILGWFAGSGSDGEWGPVAADPTEALVWQLFGGVEIALIIAAIVQGQRAVRSKQP